MANTNEPFRRVGSNSWKELLDAVNDKLENPPSDTECEPISTIDIPDECHRWSKDDIQEVHDKLNEMPGDCFDFQAIPDLWKKSIIDDVENQLDNAWCDCEAEGCTTDTLDAEKAKTGTTTSLGSLPPVLWTNCEDFADPGNNILYTEDGSLIEQGRFLDPCTSLDGVQISVAGVNGRSVSFGTSISAGGTPIPAFSAPVKCDGTIDLGCDGPHQVLIPHQRFGNCSIISSFACGTVNCDNIFAAALAQFASDPTTFVFMTLKFNGATCVGC